MIEKLIVDTISEEANEEINRIIEEELNELHLRREIERMLNDYFKLFALHYVEGEYFIYDALYYTTQGPYTLQQCHDKLRELSGEE